MSEGAVILDLPQGLCNAAHWRVEAGGARGGPGEALAVAAGECPVLIEARITHPRNRLGARLRVSVPVAAGRITRLRLPLVALAEALDAGRGPGRRRP